MILRCEVRERDHDDRPRLPAIVTDADVVVIGSGIHAVVRLPAAAARDEHVVLEGPRWRLVADAHVDGAPRRAGDRGEIGASTTFVIGRYEVAVDPAPAGLVRTAQARTESLARELVRGLLGDAAPTLVVERGPNPGSSCALPPPEATVVIGRGDEATWVLLDPDLSRSHAEIRRGWDGTWITDLGSARGTRVDGVLVDRPTQVLDGARITLAGIELRYRDPAERHLRGAAGPPAPVAPTQPLAGEPRRSGAPAARWLARVALLVLALSVAALGWVIAS